MRKYLAILAVGMAIGIMINRLSDRQAPASVAEVPAAKEEIKPATQPKQQALVNHGPEAIRTPASIQTPEKTQGVRIEEDTVRELEQEGEVLREHAAAEQREDGWQIHVYEEDRALLHSGLSDGDIITNESLNSQLQSQDRAALATRFVAVLKYIER